MSNPRDTSNKNNRSTAVTPELMAVIIDAQTKAVRAVIPVAQEVLLSPLSEEEKAAALAEIGEETVQMIREYFANLK